MKWIIKLGCYWWLASIHKHEHQGADSILQCHLTSDHDDIRFTASKWNKFHISITSVSKASVSGLVIRMWMIIYCQMNSKEWISIKDESPSAKTGIFWTARSIPCLVLLMLWLSESPWHQQPQYCLCMINGSQFLWGRISTTCMILALWNDRKCK